MLNITVIISETFSEVCEHKYTIEAEAENIAKVSFGKFSVIFYYSAYEFELGVNYKCKRQESDFNTILLNLGCEKSAIPSFRFMSNEEVTREYVKEYVILLNRYYKKLEG